MKITKDEARILAAVLDMAKYDLKSLPEGAFNKLNEFQLKLEKHQKDKRRTGRTSQDSFRDCIKRFTNK